ncbi:hypothetical protein CR513_51194, partial [Mucuna pruriens]
MARRILKIVGAVAYKLQQPKGYGEHLIDSTLHADIELDGPTIEHEEVLKCRSIVQHAQQVPQVLIKWTSQSIVEATCEASQPSKLFLN